MIKKIILKFVKRKDFLKKDFRKIGITFFTTGLITLSIGHGFGVSSVFFGCSWLIISGILAIYLGVK